MITFPQAVRDALRSVQCALLNDNAYVVGSVGRFAGPVRQRALDGINATRDLLGCPPTAPIEPPPPGFNGGQCPVSYFVIVNWKNQNTDGSLGTEQSQNVTGSLGRPGPIRGVERRGEPGSWQMVLLHGTDSLFTDPESVVRSSTSAQESFVELSITSVSRVDGGPDNCGDPDPVYPPPNNYNTDIDVTYNIDNGDEVTITVPFVFAPITVDLNGNFRIPVTFDFGGNQFSASFPLDVSIPITVNFPGLNPGDGQGVEELPPDAPGETVPPLPPEEKIVGVVVNVLSFDTRKVSSYDSPGIPRLLVPRAGSVKFAYSLGAATFWSPDIDIKGEREFIPCPFSQGADAVVASPQIGVNLSFVPIRGFPLATRADIPPPD